MSNPSTTVTASLSTEFESLASNLASAEFAAKGAASDLSQARAQRQQSAVEVINHLFASPPYDPATGALLSQGSIRSIMIHEGVLKGTVSKILTVVEALVRGQIEPSDVKSLNGAYNAAKAAHKAALAAALEPETPEPEPAGPALIAVPTPDEALELILDSIKNAGDEDAVFRAAGEWIEKITTAISDVTRNFSEDSEEDF